MMFKRLCILLALCLITYSLYDTQFLPNVTVMNLMVGQYSDLKLPITLQKYESISFRANPLQMEVCQIEDFAIDFQQKQFSFIGILNTAIDVITSYDYLLSSTHMVDMALFDQFLYLLYSDGLRKVNYKGNLEKFLPQPWINRTFQKSKFIINKTNSNIYLVDSNVFIRLSGDSYAFMRGYVKLKQFTSACFMNETTIAVLDKFEGVTIYQIEEDNAIFIFNFRKQHFGWDINFVDIVAYDKKTLFVLDQKKGVVKLTLDDKLISTSPVTLVLEISRDCTKLKLQKHHLYLVCTELNKFSITNLTNKQYDHPNFRIRDVLIVDNKPMVVGNNIIKLYNGNNEIDSHMNSQISKIITTGNNFIVGNKRGVKTVTWNITQPTITCGIKRQTVSPPTQAHFLLDVLAKCNKTYFDEQYIDFGVTQNEEMCLYHFPVVIFFWVGKEVDYTPLKISLIVIGSLMLTVALVWIFFRRKISKLKGFLMNYKFIEDSTTTDINVNKSYEKFNDVLEEGGKSEESRKQSKVESELHDIGD